MLDPWARVLWQFAQIREQDRLDSLARESERFDLMRKFAAAISMAMTGETRPMDDMREDFERRMADREEVIPISEKYADLMAEQDAIWADFNEKESPWVQVNRPEPGQMVS